MFCPECGTQNPDTAKFCVRCGYQNPTAGGGAPMPAQMAATAPANSGSKLPWVFGALALLVIAGLIGFMLYRNNSNASAGEGSPTPRP
ncbi:MAG: zinc-ribbon domain-containing protein, partial [Pyrinomonadaceae bacterium]